jgi:hypothetical protein
MSNLLLFLFEPFCFTNLFEKRIVELDHRVTDIWHCKDNPWFLDEFFEEKEEKVLYFRLLSQNLTC